jgi:hypothetical protein
MKVGKRSSARLVKLHTANGSARATFVTTCAHAQDAHHAHRASCSGVETSLLRRRSLLLRVKSKRRMNPLTAWHPPDADAAHKLPTQPNLVNAPLAAHLLCPRAQ